VHACCGMCKTAIKGLFPDSKISYAVKVRNRPSRSKAGELYRGTVLEALRKPASTANSTSHPTFTPARNAVRSGLISFARTSWSLKTWSPYIP